MRKWMRDRLKRRKKETEAGPAPAAPAPLQPAFYDIQPPSAAEAETQPAEPVSGPEEGAQEAPQGGETSESKATAANGRRRRRRRGKGTKTRGSGPLKP